MKSQDIRNMVALSARKAHIEAVRRIQTMLIQEMGSAGISHTLTDVWKKRLENAMNDLNVAIGEAEHVISEELLEEQFKHESELDELNKKKEVQFELDYEYEKSDDIIMGTKVGTKSELAKFFKEDICELYDDGYLTSLVLKHNSIPMYTGFDDVQNYLQED